MQLDPGVTEFDGQQGVAPRWCLQDEGIACRDIREWHCAAWAGRRGVAKPA